jgi:hypothetical protein
MKKNFALVALLSVVLSGCLIINQTTTLPPSPYVGTVPLSGQIIHTPDGDMIATIPQGWILLDTQNKADQNTQIVLTDTAYSGIIFFSKLPVTESVMATVRQDGLEEAARKSYQHLQEKTHGEAKLTTDYQTFGVDDREFCSYEYSADNRRSVNRVVVFSTGKQIYQCVAVQLSTDEKPMMKFQDLCSAQQSVVNTIRW